MQKISFIFILLLIPAWMYSQEIKPKKFDHYAGVQVNQLIKEIINLNASSSTIDNPYLLEYSLIHNGSNFGLNFGFGYDYTKEADQSNPDASYLEINDLSYFVGICKRQTISPKFELTYGIDYASNYFINRSYSNEVVDFGTNFQDSTYFQVKDETKTWGVGLDVMLRYYLSKRILLGTQMNYFYTQGEQKSNTMTYTVSSSPTTETQSIETTNEGSDISEFTFQLPVAIFLILKF